MLDKSITNCIAASRIQNKGIQQVHSAILQDSISLFRPNVKPGQLTISSVHLAIKRNTLLSLQKNFSHPSTNPPNQKYIVIDINFHFQVWEVKKWGKIINTRQLQEIT